MNENEIENINTSEKYKIIDLLVKLENITNNHIVKRNVKSLISILTRNDIII